MSKPIISIGMFCSLVIAILIFDQSSTLGFTNLHGDLNSTLTHGEKNRFRFFVFADVKHPAGNHARLNDIFDAAKGKKPLFMVLIGDFVSTGTEEKYKFFINKVEDSGVLKAGIPLFVALGNHDRDEKDKSRALFRKYFGPTYYWFSYGNSLFVVVDTGDSILDEAQLGWIESILKKKRDEYLHVFFFMHVPSTDFDFNQNRKIHKAKEFMELMERYRVDQVFSGHYHSYRREVQNGVAYLLTGGGGSKLEYKEDEESFFHYVEVFVNGPVITEKIVILDASHDYSDYVAYNFAIYIYPWLHSNYPYLLICLVLLSLVVSVALFRRKKRRAQH